MLAGLRAPRKISLDSGLHSQKSIRAPVNKMIGLRDLWAPQQKFQGSRAPGTPLLGPWLLFGEQGMLLFSKSKMAEVVLSQSGTELRIQDGGVGSNTRNLETNHASSWFLLRQTREKPLRATVRSFELTAIQRH